MERLFATMISGLFLVGTFQAAHAQTEKGNWLLGGTGSFKHYSYPLHHLTSNRIKVSPDLGLFVINNLAVGILPAVQWKIDHVETNNSNFDRLSSGALSIGPFVRYYVDIADKINLFARVNYNFGHHFTNQKFDPSKKYGFYQYGIGLGSAFFLSETAALEVSIGFMHYHSFNHSSVVNPPVNNNGRNHNLLEIQAGFNIYLPGK